MEGALVARGTAEQPVRFTAASADPWGSVVFADSALDATFEEVDEYTGGSILEHCVVEGGSRAVTLEGASPYLHACLFQDNGYSDAKSSLAGAALFVGEGSAPLVRDCTFTGNWSDGRAEGGAVYVDHASPVLQDNRFEGNASPYGGALSTYAMYSPIVGNTFLGNSSDWEGGAFSLVSSSPAVLNNAVTDNSAVADGGGVHGCVTCYPHANPILMDNTISGNTNLGLGAAGLGAAYLRAFVSNNLHDNTQGGEPADFAWFHQAAEVDPDLDAAGNWWGTTDPDAIAATITDGDDEEGYGKVAVDPVLSGPVDAAETRVVVTTERIEYAFDDEMPVFLTLYNPGEAREVLLRVLLQVEDGPVVPYAGDFDLPGAMASDGGWLVSLPENAVLFRVPLAPVHEPGSGMAHLTWYAALDDPDTGALVGVVSSARFYLETE